MPTAAIRFRGTKEVMNNLQREINGLRVRSAKGLIEGVAWIHRDTEKTPPLTPVKTGALRASWNTMTWWERRRFWIKFGYAARYALYVHERLGDINWTRPMSGPQWLKASIERNRPIVLALITREVRLNKLIFHQKRSKRINELKGK